jgi:DNA-binding transcriptional MerR regulator
MNNALQEIKKALEWANSKYSRSYDTCRRIPTLNANHVVELLEKIKEKIEDENAENADNGRESVEAIYRRYHWRPQ